MYRRFVFSTIGATIALSFAALATTLVSAGHTRGAAPVNDAMRVHTAATTTTSTTPVAQLTYQGGSVEKSPAVYVVYWGKWWSTPVVTGTNGMYSYTNQQAMTYIGAPGSKPGSTSSGFLTNVGGSSWSNVMNQYCQGAPAQSVTCPSGTTHIANTSNEFRGAFIDSTNAIPATPTMTDVANEAASAAGYAAKNLGYNPATQDATFFVFTPSTNSVAGYGTSWCATHGITSYNGGTNNLAFAYIPYEPAFGATCGTNSVNTTSSKWNSFGNGYFDGFSITAGHEYAEAEVNPSPVTGSAAWLDYAGNENADKCIWNPISANISLGGRNYAVQPTWSNAAGACVLK